MRRLLATLPLLAIAGCDLVREPSPLEFENDYIAVHGLLLAGQDTVSVLITRAIPSDAPDAPYPPSITEPVADAQVRIRFGGRTITLRPDGVTPDRCAGDQAPNPSLAAGCYLGVVDGGVQPGVSYELDIVLPGGGTITGTTIVPPLPTLRTDVPQPTLEAGWSETGTVLPPALSVYWDVHTASTLYRLSLRLTLPGCAVMVYSEESVPANWLDVIGRASIDVRAFRVQCSGGNEQESFQGELQLTRFDDVYARYAASLTHDRSIPEHDLAFGLTGAAGVLGSAATARIPVTVIQPRPE